MRRKDFDPDDAGIVCLWTVRTASDPFRQNAIIKRADLETLPAFVRHGSRRFEQHETARGIAGRDAPAHRAASQRQVVPLIIITAQRKLETVLAGRSSMASS